jgi:hypothetical protein
MLQVSLTEFSRPALAFVIVFASPILNVACNSGAFRKATDIARLEIPLIFSNDYGSGRSNVGVPTGGRSNEAAAIEYATAIGSKSSTHNTVVKISTHGFSGT